MTSAPISILGTGSYLPGEPVGIDRVEDVLGRLDGLNGRLAGRIDPLRERLLARSGVAKRHFAIDPQTRQQTETNASMAEKAAREALSAAKVEPDGVDLLIFSSPAADCMTPPTSVLVQERLGIRQCTEIEIHSNCTGVPKGIQIALDMLRQGRYRTALVVYAQLSSIFLRKEFLNQSKLTLEHLTLRWMLSDGAGAIVLGRADNGAERPQMVDAYVESVGLGQAPGMTMELGAQRGPELAHVGTSFLHSLFEEGRHHLWQDIAKVARVGTEMLLAGLRHMLDAFQVAAEDVQTFILPFPGQHFITADHKETFRRVVGVDSDGRVPFLVSQFGYCGGAASLVQLDRMSRAGLFVPGSLVAGYVEESSKWMSGGFLARWQ
jgi:3-oxoacyl-[acyl-carrier-protein] synthase III